MGIKERKTRQQQELKQQILDSAKKIAFSEGWEAVTMRRIADTIEYSLPIIYKYFASKEAILASIALEGFTQLHNYLVDIQQKTQEPKEMAINLAQSYVQFAMENKILYKLMFDLEGIIFLNNEVLQESEKMFGFVENSLKTLVEKINAKIENPNQTAELVWSAMHGIASLCIVGRIYNAEEKYKNLASEMMDSFFCKWEIV